MGEGSLDSDFLVLGHCGYGMEMNQVSLNPKPQIPKPWILVPLSNSWIISIIWLYIALNRTPNIDCYWVGAVPDLNPKPRILNP